MRRKSIPLFILFAALSLLVSPNCALADQNTNAQAVPLHARRSVQAPITAQPALIPSGNNPDTSLRIKRVSNMEASGTTALSTTPGGSPSAQTSKFAATSKSDTPTSPAAAVSAQNSTSKPDVQTQLQEGIKFSRHGLYKDAADFFTRAANAAPDNAEPYNRRARAEWQLEQMKEALEDANWAIKLNPDYAEAFCTRSAIHNSMSLYQDAVADASMAMDLKPNLRDAYMLQVIAYRNLGEHQEADAVQSRMNALDQPESAFDEWQPKVDYTGYLTYLQFTVKKSWRAPAGVYAPAVALFKVHRNGQVSDVRLNSTTGDVGADNSALQAVRDCAPFREPPAGTPPDFDVYVVLEPLSAKASPPGPNPAQPTGVGQFNVINQGIGIMRRYLPVVH